MHIYDLVKRQSTVPSGGSGTSGSTDPTLPTYIWVIVVIFVCVSITCGICARKNRHRQNLYRQAILNSQRPTSDRNSYAPPWTAFSRPSGEVLQPLPRARRRASQASVTSLPVYMENPGAQEVVLLQRAIPKDEDAQTPSTRQPTGGGDAGNAEVTNGNAPPQPISVSPPTLLLPPTTMQDESSPLPAYRTPPTPSTPAIIPSSSRSPAAPRHAEDRSPNV